MACSCSREFIRLAPVTEGEMKYASVSGSHANQVMRLWHYRQKHADPKMTTQEVLSLEILEAKDPQYFHAIEHAEWLVFSKEVSSIPDLPTLLQQCANTSGQLMRPETELQLCFRLLNLWKSHEQEKSKEPVEYSILAPIILRSKPPHSEVLPYLYKFILKVGGGSSGQLIRATEAFAKGFGSGGRSLGCKIWDSLAEEVRGDDQLILWRHAILKACLCCPNLISAADIKKSFKNAQAANVATMLKRLRSIGGGLPDNDLERILGIFQVESVMIVMSKKATKLPAPFVLHESLDYAGFKAVELMRDCGPGFEQLVSPWTGPEAVAASKSSKGSERQAYFQTTLHGLLCIFHAFPSHVIPCHAMPSHAMPCHAMPCQAMPCHAMPCHALLYMPRLAIHAMLGYSCLHCFSCHAYTWSTSL